MSYLLIKSQEKALEAMESFQERCNDDPSDKHYIGNWQGF